MNLIQMFQEESIEGDIMSPSVNASFNESECNVAIQEVQPLVKKERKVVSAVRKEKKNKKDYIDKTEFFQAIEKYFADRDAAALEGRRIKIPDKIGNYFQILSKRIFSSKKFYGSHYMIEELISAGVEDCLKGLNKFDLTRNEKNPFGYFSQAAYRAGIRVIYDAVNEKEGRNSLITNAYTNIAEIDEECQIQRDVLIDWYDADYYNND